MRDEDHADARSPQPLRISNKRSRVATSSAEVASSRISTRGREAARGRCSTPDARSATARDRGVEVGRGAREAARAAAPRERASSSRDACAEAGRRRRARVVEHRARVGDEHLLEDGGDPVPRARRGARIADRLPASSIEPASGACTPERILTRCSCRSRSRRRARGPRPRSNSSEASRSAAWPESLRDVRGLHDRRRAGFGGDAHDAASGINSSRLSTPSQ